MTPIFDHMFFFCVFLKSDTILCIVPSLSGTVLQQQENIVYFHSITFSMPHPTFFCVCQRTFYHGRANHTRLLGLCLDLHVIVIIIGEKMWQSLCKSQYISAIHCMVGSVIVFYS